MVLVCPARPPCRSCAHCSPPAGSRSRFILLGHTSPVESSAPRTQLQADTEASFTLSPCQLLSTTNTPLSMEARQRLRQYLLKSNGVSPPRPYWHFGHLITCCEGTSCTLWQPACPLHIARCVPGPHGSGCSTAGLDGQCLRLHPARVEEHGAGTRQVRPGLPSSPTGSLSKLLPPTRASVSPPVRWDNDRLRFMLRLALAPISLCH